MSEEETDAGDTSLSCCCASCGIAELDDTELVPCDGCDLVKYCGDDCRKTINQNTKKTAKSVPLNYVINYYSSNRKAPISGIVRSAVCLCHLT